MKVYHRNYVKTYCQDMETAKIHKCPHRSCKTRAIPTKEERKKHKSYFISRLTREGWMLALGKNGYNYYCPECYKKYLL
jgi:hypothetical protein